MPWIMEQPYDLAFERSGDDVVLKLEEFDVARRIRMEWNGDRAAQAFTPHGFSTGVWQDRTLVVTTTNLNSPNFKFEIPASDKAEIVERFTPTVAGDRLDYEIVVTDPVYVHGAGEDGEVLALDPGPGPGRLQLWSAVGAVTLSRPSFSCRSRLK